MNIPTISQINVLEIKKIHDTCHSLLLETLAEIKTTNQTEKV